MAYNNPAPAQSTTLTADERSREARKNLGLLREEQESELERKLTGEALRFVQGKWMELDLGGKVAVSPNQLLWLRDLKSKFD